MNNISISTYCVCWYTVGGYCHAYLFIFLPPDLLSSVFMPFCFHLSLSCAVELTTSSSPSYLQESCKLIFDSQQIHFIFKVRFVQRAGLPAPDQSRTVYIRAVGDKDCATETERADKKTEVKTREKVRRREQMRVWWNSTYTKWAVHTKKTTVLSTVLSYSNLLVNWSITQITLFASKKILRTFSNIYFFSSKVFYMKIECSLGLQNVPIMECSV